MPGAPILAETTGLSYRYRWDAPLALRDVSMSLSAGDIVMLLGPSASGKTTLLSLLGTLRRPPAGQVHLFGIDIGTAADDQITCIRRRMRFVFQKHYLLRSMTVLQNVMVGSASANYGRKSAIKDALATLAAVGLADQAHRWPHELSSGQQQRVAVARALVGQPEVLLADEPTASLDRESALALADGIRNFAAEQGCGVIIATHDDRITSISTRQIRLQEGSLAAGS